MLLGHVLPADMLWAGLVPKCQPGDLFVRMHCSKDNIAQQRKHFFFVD